MDIKKNVKGSDLDQDKNKGQYTSEPERGEDRLRGGTERKDDIGTSSSRGEGGSWSQAGQTGKVGPGISSAGQFGVGRSGTGRSLDDDDARFGEHNPRPGNRTGFGGSSQGTGGSDRSSRPILHDLEEGDRPKDTGKGNTSRASTPTSSRGTSTRRSSRDSGDF